VSGEVQFVAADGRLVRLALALLILLRGSLVRCLLPDC
jgi:hypothetical protein